MTTSAASLLEAAGPSHACFANAPWEQLGQRSANPHQPHRSRLLLILLFAPLALAGCGTAPPQSEVVVYVAIDRRDAEPILQDFERQYGIRVRALYDAEAAKTTGLVTRLVAEASHPRCDVFWNNEIAQTLALAERDVLASYNSTQAAGIPDAWRDPQARWTGMALRSRVIVFNTRHLSREKVPRTLAELTDPKWRGRVAMANPQFGTTRTHVAALFAHWGPENARAWLSALLANEVRIVDGNAMVKNLVARADLDASPILLGLTDTDDVLAGQRQGEPIDFIYPDQDGDGTLVIPSTVCLIRGGPHSSAGQRLVDYLVSPETEQRLATADSGYSPVRNVGPASRHRLPRAMAVAYGDLVKQLDVSTRWTTQHFHD